MTTGAYPKILSTAFLQNYWISHMGVSQQLWQSDLKSFQKVARAKNFKSSYMFFEGLWNVVNMKLGIVLIL